MPPQEPKFCPDIFCFIPQKSFSNLIFIDLLEKLRQAWGSGQASKIIRR
jgi:hypothetical protein